MKQSPVRTIMLCIAPLVWGLSLSPSHAQVDFDFDSHGRNGAKLASATLGFSTYLGGSSSDQGRGISVGTDGKVYVTGDTYSPDFPTVNAYQAGNGGSIDAFVSVLSSTGSSLVYSTYLGGNDTDSGYGISAGTDGVAYVAGTTLSSDFPTENPYQAGQGGIGYYDVFVSALSSAGSSLVYSTYLGGGNTDQGRGISAGTDGRAYVTGYTYSPDFPTENPYQAVYGGGGQDGFVSALSATGSSLVYSTYLGGNDYDYGHGISAGTDGVAYVAGTTLSSDFPTENPYQAGQGGIVYYDAFVSSLSSAGSALVYSTYLGGSSTDQGRGISVGTDGRAYVTGDTYSPDFPTVNAYQAVYGGGSQDGFVSALSATGSVLSYSTYLGGSGEDRGHGISAGMDGGASVTGYTDSSDFPTENPYQAGLAGGQDAFVSALSATGSALSYSTYLGGVGADQGRGISAGTDGAAYVAGSTGSTDFPTMNPYQAWYGGNTDAFVARISFFSPPPTATITSTNTPTSTPTSTPTNTSTRTPTNTPTKTSTPAPSPTGTPTLSPSNTPTVTPTPTNMVCLLELEYSTFLGGSDTDTAWGVAVDSASSAYVAGQSWSTDFPTLNPYQAGLPGFGNVVVSKFSPSGSNLVYSTYLGGSVVDEVRGIALDSLNCAYLGGHTISHDFPTVNPYQAALGGGFGDFDYFVSKLSSTGSVLLYSTYLGGSDPEQGGAIAVDAALCAYITGMTYSADFPTLNPYQAAYPGASSASITKLSATGSSLVYSSFLGGSAGEATSGVAVDGDGNSYVVGYTDSADFPTVNPYQASFAAMTEADAFVTKFSSTGSSLLYSTYLGGSSFDEGRGIALGADRSAYAIGITDSDDFPTYNSYQPSRHGNDDVWVTKLSSSGSSLVYSSYLGSSADDDGYGIALDGDGRAHAVGETWASDFPLVNPYQPVMQGIDAFLTRFDISGSALFYSTLLGGSGDDYGRAVAVDSADSAFAAGFTNSTDFPVENPYQSFYGGAGDIFLGKFSWNCYMVTPTPTSTQTPTPTWTFTPTDTPTHTPTHTPTNTPTISPTNTPTATQTISATPTITPTALPIVPLVLMKDDQGGFDYNAYGYELPVGGDWTQADAAARNPSPLARDLWQIPMNNNTLAMTEIDADGIGAQALAVLKADQGGFDRNLYLYNVPVPADYWYWDAYARNPSPLARDFWIIPEGNDTVLIADGGSNLAAMKDEGGDYNLYLYESPYPGDWVYWESFARNPSPLARDFWVIPQGDDAAAMCGLDTTGDGDSDSLAVVRNDAGTYLLYLWNMPQAGDWTYWDAFSRNPSPLARDFWVIPQRDDIASIAGIGAGIADELSVMEDGGGDYAFYLWNAPVPGDWTYWDAVSRNPSPVARDLWEIPAGNDTVDMAAPSVTKPF